MIHLEPALLSDLMAFLEKRHGAEVPEIYRRAAGIHWAGGPVWKAMAGDITVCVGGIVHSQIDEAWIWTCSESPRAIVGIVRLLRRIVTEQRAAMGRPIVARVDPENFNGIWLAMLCGLGWNGDLLEGGAVMTTEADEWQS